MKTVFSNSEICHIFARQTQETGRTSNGSIFFDGNTIFSYGRHFPMASIDKEKNIAFITNRRYSNTTATHLGQVWGALSHFSKVSCYNPLNAFNNIHGENIRYFVTDYLEAVKNEIKGRKKSKYIKQKIYFLDFLISYVAVCPDAAKHLTELQKEWLTESYQTNLKASLLEAQTKEAQPKISLPKDPIKEAAKIERLAAKVAEYKAGYCTAWIENRLDSFNDSFTKEVKNQVKKTATGYNNRSHGEYRFTEWLISQGTTGNVLLRANNGNLETSKGVKIPLPIAQRYFNQFKAGTLGAEISGYRINERETDKHHLVVGCHTIEVKYIESFAKSQNWL